MRRRRQVAPSVLSSLLVHFKVIGGKVVLGQRAVLLIPGAPLALGVEQQNVVNTTVAPRVIVG